MTKRFDVIAVGELNPDLILTGIKTSAPVLGTEHEFSDMTLTLGSSTAICCVLMQRLGLATAMAAKVGDDDHGAFCKSVLKQEGVDQTGIITDAAVQTGVTVSLAYPEDRLLLTRYGAMAAFGLADIDLGALTQARHLHLGSFFLQERLQPDLPELFRHAHDAGMTTSLDLGWDPSEKWDTEILREMLPYVSVILPNRVELSGITGIAEVEPALTRLHEMGANEIALKNGSKGSLASINGNITRAASLPITPLDTTGAGDAFNAGYITARLEGKDTPERLKLGNACGALTASKMGGTGGFTTRQEVHDFLKA
ncbi:carbohydrate kinase family protein (plasmid) [Falsihalocynthiibacter sp. SS001]|uniref:carbohydrate kinase family protein n=1 Tax=Falsihalocynthiibacter sp. SS001 TaxID=3349698 RepID=UPI0036D2333E